MITVVIDLRNPAKPVVKSTIPTEVILIDVDPNTQKPYRMEAHAPKIHADHLERIRKEIPE